MAMTGIPTNDACAAANKVTVLFSLAVNTMCWTSRLPF